jgi:hypothetical protein
MKSQSILISLSEEAAGLLADNEIDLLTELQKEGLQVQRGERPMGVPAETPGSKSIELVILAAAASTPLIAQAIIRIIDVLVRNRGAKITQRVWTPMMNAEGRPMTDQNGQPIMSLTETTQPAITTSGKINEEHSTKVSLFGLKVELVDKQQGSR